MALFKKAACFTDIHFGMKSGSRLHNKDCEDFIEWFIKEAKKENCEVCIFLGDWHHNRATTDVSTMNYSVSNLEKLNNAFDKTYLMLGNHDEFYKDKREIHSLEFARLFPNIVSINAPLTDGDVTLLPWLVGDEWKKVKDIKSRYVFGHFELPLFYMNAMVQMPDHGTLQADDFVNQEYVFSGHFHKRQEKGNVAYIGNAFGHNYSDAWDDERGVTILDWGKPHEYLTWPDAPKYRTIKISQLLDGPDEYLSPKTYARITLDVDISYEEANFIKETFIEQYQLRELSLIPNKNVSNLDQETVGEINFESVDTIVSSQLTQVESESYDNNLLMEIYRNL